MKLLSWNVNGIRSVAGKGFPEWLKSEDADIVCLQETKAHPDQLDLFLLNPAEGYQSYWSSAEKAGYSGVAVYTRREPLSVANGIGLPEFDNEGRVLVLEFPEFTLVNAYFPNSQRDHARLDYKLEFCGAMLKVLKRLEKKGQRIVLCGDFNIAHRAIDLKNPKANEKNAGYLPEERAWMDRFVGEGFVDSFRHFHPDARDQYTWWSYRPGIRERNIGWRLDYFCTSEALKGNLASVAHQPHVKGSDHCPVELRLAL